MGATKRGTRVRGWARRLRRPSTTLLLLAVLLGLAWSAGVRNPRGLAGRALGVGDRRRCPWLEPMVVARVGGDIRVVPTDRESWDAWGPLVQGGAERFVALSPGDLEVPRGIWGGTSRGIVGVGALLWEGAGPGEVELATRRIVEYYNTAGVPDAARSIRAGGTLAPDWVGVFIDGGTVGTLGLLAASLGWVPARWRALRRREGRCAGCGYDLRLAGGGNLGRCPECGRVSDRK